MVVTFQIQIDPMLPDRVEPNPDFQFTSEQLDQMHSGMREFVEWAMESFGQYVRAEMYVDGEVYRGV